MGITKPCTHLHPAPSTSTQLISTSTQLSGTPSTPLELKYCTKLGNFPKFRTKNQKLSKSWLKIGTYGTLEVLILNLDLDFGNSDPKIQFWANLGQKKSKLSILPENWHTWCLEDADSYSDISFLNF